MGEKGNGGNGPDNANAPGEGTGAQDEGANDPIGGVGIGLGSKSNPASG